MKIYHNPRCSKSRETLAIIQKAGKQVEIIDYQNQVPTEKELIAIIKLLGINAEDLVRKGEDVYKEKFKGKKITQQEWVKILIEHPKLIERPIVINGDKAIIGRPPEKVLELF
ncbi:MAG: arsenate reductase (glutaredoxin) [Flavobacteriales bacterium]|jgi:arsenate reductase|nr:arsenate reductase (glutaredoxin) [Flavobacteriales bacterium]